jgi:DNA-binding CsgD family transcriptional regulator
MAIRPGAAEEASDARMTWPTTFRLLVRGEDREPPLVSHREREILALAVTGLTNRQIAARLHVTQSTVKTHLSWAFGRLGVHSRGGACCCLHATRTSGATCCRAGPIRRAGSPAAPMSRRVGLLLTPVAYGGAVALANVGAVRRCAVDCWRVALAKALGMAPAPGDDVALAGARSWASP